VSVDSPQPKAPVLPGSSLYHLVFLDAVHDSNSARVFPPFPLRSLLLFLSREFAFKNFIRRLRSLPLRPFLRSFLRRCRERRCHLEFAFYRLLEKTLVYLPLDHLMLPSRQLILSYRRFLARLPPPILIPIPSGLSVEIEAGLWFDPLPRRPCLSRFFNKKRLLSVWEVGLSVIGL